MKKGVIILVLFLSHVATFGQTDTIIFESLDFTPPDPPVQYIQEIDLMEHSYWKCYLLPFGKKSIKTDSTIEEAYRLIYWGRYYASVELILKDNSYYLTADSSAWGGNFDNGIVHRFRDTLTSRDQIQEIYTYCSINKNDKIILEPEDPYEIVVLDDRDNWAFEYKIGSAYRAFDGIEVSAELEIVYSKLMEIGGLSGYVIIPE